METSAACFSRLSSSSSSSILFSPFSDQSHLDFYHPRPSSLAFSPLRFSNPRPLRALCDSASFPPPPLVDPASDQNILMKELAELKLQLKQKKKEVKSQMKDEKKKLKVKLKEGKNAMKKKDCTEGKKKRKKKCESESSSSSESSDEDCKSVSMGMLREESASISHSEGMFVRAQMDENLSTCSDQGFGADAGSPTVTEGMRLAKDSEKLLSARQKTINFNGDTGSTCRGSSTLGNIERSTFSAQCPTFNSPFSQAANRIEVCAGGKCKKAGSEQLLLALGVHIPSSSNVVAVPCKCMGKCSMAMNVKVHKEDTNPQHHSHVRVEDANLILNHHFGLGRSPTGLPALPPQDGMRVPLTMGA
ncbi:hypothetical protein GOP47_0014128 [Adiantum capillus-veneris]|uniref:Uncharacterized protein n=1 Tax=Adiantum capillus-veneris TaxID=13818 RepID=A0A9D4UQU3_ADICA|nr:hypothetical protein GOP47_0014128 [Adiantum capillus-veneris]